MARMARHEQLQCAFVQVVAKEETLIATDDSLPPDVQSLLKQYSDVYPDDLSNELPPHRDVDHKIELEAGSQPPSRPTFRMSPKELDEQKQQSAELTKHGFIQPSKSPYGASVLFVKK